MISLSTRMRRLSGIAIAAAAAAVVLGASPALAHDNLVDSAPSAGETVASLDAVELTFSGELIDFSQTSFAQVQGPDALFYETTCSTIDRNVLTTPVALGSSGTYTVLWNAVSSDGHPISESYQFEYVADPETDVALGWDAPACGNEDTRVQPGAVPTSTPTPADEAEPTVPEQDADGQQMNDDAQAAEETNENGLALAIVAGVVVIAASAVVTVLLVHRRRNRAE